MPTYMPSMDELHSWREGDGAKMARAVARTAYETVSQSGGGVAQLGFKPGGDNASRAERYVAVAALVDESDAVRAAAAVHVLPGTPARAPTAIWPAAHDRARWPQNTHKCSRLAAPTANCPCRGGQKVSRAHSDAVQAE